MSGFKNAPAVSAFKMGMEVNYVGTRLTVAWVDAAGQAHCAAMSGCECVLSPRENGMGQATLDLSSIWLGRKYKGRFSGLIHTVVALGPYYVGTTSHNETHKHMYTREAFRKLFDPLSLEPEQPVSEPWKPEAGTKCLRVLVDGTAQEVVPRSVMAHQSWVVPAYKLGDDEYDGFIVKTVSLHPLPPAPPVQVGDVVMTTWKKGGERLYGRVEEVRAENHSFDLRFNDLSNVVHIDWQSVTITKLVPEGAER